MKRCLSLLVAFLALGACAARRAPVDVDAGVESSGVYMDGVDTCCGPEQGLGCCTADAGLTAYDVAPDGSITKIGDQTRQMANCFRYGGTGACSASGHVFDAKETCSICCGGLSRINASLCDKSAPPSLFVCLPCGNGVCDEGESSCSCPEDCP
jgi:hypothetical protein